MNEEVSASDLLGKTIKTIDRHEEDGCHLIFTMTDGSKYDMYHSRDCCEVVVIDDINGDLNDLLGYPLLQSEESTNDGQNDDEGTFTWTFYKFATIKGYVTIKWYGTSNGYYSESVEIYKIK